MYTQFHSQFGEDQFLEANNMLPSIGVFVDVGAGHPILLSNTYRLEQRGWTGLCIDADPRQVELLRAARKTVEHFAICRLTGFVDLHRVGCAELSTTLNQLSRCEDQLVALSVPAIDLESLLEKHEIQKIDLLSIDTEGNEIEVLESMNLEKHCPEVIIAEYNTEGRESNETALREYFDRNNYALVHKTHCNLIYKRCIQPDSVEV